MEDLVVQMNKSKLKGFRICNNCGKLILIYHKERLNRALAFCCKKCEGEYRKKKTQNNCTCSYCGKRFHKKPSHIKEKNYCSKECFYKSKEINMLGENNHQYGLRGNKNSSWKSNERITSNGYIRIYMPEHPLSDESGRILEHRYVAEKYLAKDDELIEVDNKKVLNPNLDVHHIDKNKLNNNVDNLKILTRSDHAKIHQGEKHKNNSVIKICQSCGNEYSVIKSRENTSKFCSKECANNYRNKDRIKLECPICHKVFLISKNEKNRTCCSVECSNKLRKRESFICKCDYCGKEFKIKKSVYDKSNKHYCCRECYYNSRKSTGR